MNVSTCLVGKVDPSLTSFVPEEGHTPVEGIVAAGHCCSTLARTSYDSFECLRKSISEGLRQ